MKVFYIYNERLGSKPCVKNPNTVRVQCSERHPVAAVGVEVVNGVVNTQFAVCSPKDNFNRRIARQIVSGRMAKNPIMTINGNIQQVFKDNNVFIKQKNVDWTRASKMFGETISDIVQTQIKTNTQA